VNSALRRVAGEARWALRKAVPIAVIGGGIALALLCFGWPAMVALAEVVRSGDLAAGALSARRWGLIGAGVGVSAQATILALLLGSLLAVGLAARSRVLRGIVVWVSACAVMTPPYLYAYAWSLPILPEGLVTAAALTGESSEWVTWWRAVLCLGSWCAPIVAAAVCAGWRNAGRAVYQVALLDAGPVAALLRAALPVMTPWLLVAGALVFVLTTSEFSVCHLCLVQTWNTEILAEAQLGRPGRALLLGWPLVALVLGVVAALAPARGMIARLLRDLVSADWQAGQFRGGRGRACGAAAASMAVAVLLMPWGILWAYFGDLAALPRAWQVFLVKRGETTALLYASGAAIGALWLTLTVDYLCMGRAAGAGLRAARAVGGLVLVAAGLAAILPPVVVGDAYQASYVSLPLVYDSSLILCLALAARLALVPAGLALVTGEARSVPYEDMAAVDGASRWQTCWLVRWALLRDVLMMAGVLCVLLALTDVAVTQSLTPPGVGNLALTLLNQIHFGRNDEVIALCFYAGAAVALVAGGVVAARSVRRRMAATAGRRIFSG